MTIPHILLSAAVAGPRAPREVSGRDVLAEHLAWARTSRRPSSAREQPAPVEEAEFERFDGAAGTDDVAPPPLDPIDGCDVVTTAAMELEQAWQADVLASVPSQLLVGLSGIAQRAAFLLDEAAPELARRFERLGELFMSREDGERPVSDEELGLAFDELEALVPAVADRARELHARLPLASQETLLERWKAREEEPPALLHSCGGCSGLPRPAMPPRCGAKS